MNDKVINVLFLCTGNSARSILAEAILNQRGQGRFKGHSAGSHPTGKVHPIARALLERRSLPADHLRSKNWDEFAGPDAPEISLVITVCDNAAGETCPIFAGSPASAHWGLPDPAAVKGSSTEQALAFAATYQELSNRIGALLELPIATMSATEFQNEVSAIGATG